MITALKVEYVGPQKARVDLVGSVSDVAGDIPKVWGNCDDVMHALGIVEDANGV